MGGSVTYTIDDIEEAVEDGEDLFSDHYGTGWGAFEDAIQSTREPVLDADGSQVLEPSKYTPGRMVPAYRDKGWKGFDLPGIGRATHIETIGGEGQGDEYSIVFSIEDANGIRFFERSGYWASYDGAYLDDGITQEVVQAEKTVSYWKAIS